MRLGSASLLLALVVTSGCDASTPKEWQKARPDVTNKPAATQPKPLATATQPAPTVTAAPAPPKPAPPKDGENWGGSAIAWQAPTAGLAEAKRSGRPVMLVLYTTWCPHCKNYSQLFSDARVVEASKAFVMIRANSDEEEDFAGKYAPDGGYIPRTLFLGADGALRAEIRANEREYKYFYNERDAGPLLAAMERAKSPKP